MSWARFVPGFSRHPKRIKCGPLASWLWTCSVDHCATYLTDGFLDASAVAGLCPHITGARLKRCTELLVEVGSWERIDGGYKVHGYLDHNMSRTQVESDREANRQRYQRWKANARNNGPTNAFGNGCNNGVPNDSLSQSVSQSVQNQEPSKGDSRHRSRPTKLPDLLAGTLERIAAKHPELGGG